MIKSLLALTGCAATLFSAALAQDTRSYVQVHGGAFAVTQDELDTDIDIQGLEDVDVSASVDYSIGYAVGALYGLEVSPGFAIEGEVTYRSNGADGFELSIDGNEQDTNQFGDIDGSLDTFAFMANGVFTLPGNARFTPYAGAGIGYVTVDADDGVDVDGALGYQAKLGVSLPMGANEFGIEVSYFGTSGFDASDEDLGLGLDYGGVNLMAAYRFGF